MTRPTLVPASYPALVAEQYRALEDATERQTELPPAPPPALSAGAFMTTEDWWAAEPAILKAELARDAARWTSGPIAQDD